MGASRLYLFDMWLLHNKQPADSSALILAADLNSFQAQKCRTRKTTKQKPPTMGDTVELADLNTELYL